MKLRVSILGALCAAFSPPRPRRSPTTLAPTTSRWAIRWRRSRTGDPEQLAATLRRDTPKLQLVNLACPGESTPSMISGYPARPPPIPATQHYGPPCQTYPHGSQLDQAVNFLKAHRAFVRLIKIDLGGTDVLELGYEKGLAQIQQHLPAVLAVGSNTTPSSSSGSTTPRSHTPSWMWECSPTTTWRRSTPQPASPSPTSKQPSRRPTSPSSPTACRSTCSASANGR